MQVRLDADVADALRALSERDGSSMSQLANRRLRVALGLTKNTKRETRIATRNASVSVAPTGRCPHPIGRRIAGVCVLCMTRVS